MNDVRIDGSGKIATGSYGKVVVNGSAKGEGDIYCEGLRVSGTAKFLGNLEAGSVFVSGMCKVGGSLKTSEIDVSGSCKVEQDIKCKEIDVSGSMKSGNHVIHADKIHVTGSLKNEGEINADLIQIDGIIRAKLIVGDELNVPVGYSVISFPRKLTFNKVETIECTKVNIAYMSCEKLSAHDIVLRKNCNIKNIYCDGTLRYHKSCTIGNIDGDCTVIKE